MSAPLTIGVRVHVVDPDGAPLAYLSRDDVQIASRPHVGDRVFAFHLGLEVGDTHLSVDAVEQHLTGVPGVDGAPQTWAVTTVGTARDGLDDVMAAARQVGWKVQSVRDR